MPILTFLRSGLALAGALLGVAPARRKLVVRTGDPVPYRVALPEGAEIEAGTDRLSARTWDIAVMVVALDMQEGETDPLARRILTNLVMGTDSMLFELLDEEIRMRKLQLDDVVHTIGLLGGQRAAHVRGRFDDGGAEAWVDMHGTVKNGILYMLSFTVLRGVLDPHDRVLARIHKSFVLPQ